MKRILGTVFAGAAMALAGCGSVSDGDQGSDGKVAQAEQKIVGGIEATTHSMPFMVGIYLDSAAFCGGVIIGSEWVLTSAHCLANFTSAQVVAGAHDINNPGEPSQVRQTSHQLIYHSSYNASTLQNDIGVIRLSQPLSFNANIQPIDLDAIGNTPVGQTVTLAGWGRVSDGAFGLTSLLRRVDVPTISNASCAGAYGSIITSSILCTSGEGGKNSCNGDSGGAVFAGNTLVGLMSFGSSAACSAGYPAGHARISSFRDWISQNTGI
jgi:secreted trypsin-like serine protease